MDEEELKEIQNKLVYLKESGQHHKAWKLNQKMKKAIAKAKYNETKKPSKFKSIFKKSVDAVKEVASDVIDGAPDVIAKAKEVVTNTAEKVINKNPVVETPVETPVKDISQKRIVTGGIGQAYDDEGGVGNIRVNGKVIKKGEEGYEAAREELLAFNKNQKLREIKLKKLAEKNK